jgi:hypothetical protein
MLPRPGQIELPKQGEAMRKGLFVFVLVVFAPLLIAQSAMNNDSIIKLCKAGLSDEVIVTTINSSPGDYKTSADDLVALKTAGASDKVVAAVVSKAAPVPPAADPAPATALVAATSSTNKPPRVFLQSASHGSNKNAARDQSMEMSKDFEQDCTGVKVTINQNAADYTVLLNHIEHGFTRDNQIQIANKDGDLISKTKEGGSIRGNIKKACEIILTDWAKK